MKFANVIIVESPAKAKTIEGYLGNSSDYKVVSSYGHIRDLPKKELSIDVKNGFKPTYVVFQEKKTIVENLKRLVESSNNVYLASDDDREGEAISWHIKESLNLDNNKFKRIVFHEVTKKAILSALENPRNINQDLVDAQQARRILDRIVGYYISPILWKKIKRGLSAGRVQSVAVKMLVDREREINKFDSTSQYYVSAKFKIRESLFLEAELKEKMKNEVAVKDFFYLIKDSIYTLSKITRKEGKRSPSAPFTTSTLQQEVSTKFGFSVSQTMMLAQKLYEAGKITYMRTDSVNMSQEAIDLAKRVIVDKFGKEYSKSRLFKTKSNLAQEAHEAIRPTNFLEESISGDSKEKKLYEIIWKRAIASQMSDAKIDRTIVDITISNCDKNFVTTCEVLSFDGFLKVYDFESHDDGAQLFPALEEGQTLILDYVQAKEKFSKAPSRFTEASLVKSLEENGIGRPSTYAPIISTIQNRGYVVKEDRDGKKREYSLIIMKNREINHQRMEECFGVEKQKLFPTDVGMVVNDFLVKEFSNITDYNFTVKVEDSLDSIAQGKIKWVDMLSNFYDDFNSRVQQLNEKDRTNMNFDRDLGIDPVSQEPVIVRIGRYGPIAQIGCAKNSKKLRYASLRSDQRLETIVLSEALDLFKLPRVVGECEGAKIEAHIGRFGPYLSHNGLFYSVPKEKDLVNISIDECIEIINAKRESDSRKIVKKYAEDNNISIRQGRWGVYIKYGEKNIKIPKTVKDFNELTLEEVRAIISESQQL